MTPDERLRAEFEEWALPHYPDADGIQWTEEDQPRVVWPSGNYSDLERDWNTYRAAAEKRDGRYAGLVEAARGWMAVKWTVVNEEDGPVSMSLDEWARLRADLRTALAAPPEEE